MEIIISVLLGIWISVAGVVCFISYKKDFRDILKKDNREEPKNK
jgi:hypothetical protein